MSRDDFPQPVTKNGSCFSFKDKKHMSSIGEWFFDSWKTRLGYVQACATQDALFALRWTGNAAPANPQVRAGLITEGQHRPDRLASYHQHIFQGASLAIHIDLYGTAFQCTIWRLLLDLAEQATISYSELADVAGRHKAQRAVGSAVGANPLFLLVPCHRVVRSNGALGGYAYGLDLKQKILAMERNKGSLLQA